MEFWKAIVGDSSDEGEPFEGFTELDFVKIDRESDFDIDWDDLFHSCDESSCDDDDREADVGSSVDPPNFEWTTQLRKIPDLDFQNQMGIYHDLPVGATPVQFFQLFFNDKLFERFASETNTYAIQRQAEGSHDPKWKETSAGEMKVWVAINIMMGIHILPRVACYWSTDPDLNVPSISRLMSRTRFEKLGQYFHMRDRRAYIPFGQRGHDQLFKIRPVLEEVREQCARLYQPGRAISIDEAMIKFTGRLHFKQFMRGKPTPWGIKVWCLADPETGYLLDFDVYTGKSAEKQTGVY